MYEQIAANRRRTALLMLGFVLLIAAFAWILSELYELGLVFVAAAAVFAVAMTWGSYYFSDRVVIAMSRAKPADEHEHAQLINVVAGVAIAAGIRPPRVYVVDDAAPNAFATGRNTANAAVAVTTGLLEKMTRDELEGVVAHEIAHVRNRDIMVTTIAVVLAGMITLLSDWFLRGFWRVGGRGSRKGSAGAVIALAGIALAILSPLIAQLLKLAVSRRRELLADVTAIELTRYPDGLIGALRKLQDDSTVVRTASRATAHLWIESPLDTQRGKGSWLNRLFNTHPPIEERIDKLEAIGGGTTP